MIRTRLPLSLVPFLILAACSRTSPKSEPQSVGAVLPAVSAPSVVPVDIAPPKTAEEIARDKAATYLTLQDIMSFKGKATCHYIAANDTPLFADPNGKVWTGDKLDGGLLPNLGKGANGLMKSAVKTDNEDPHKQYQAVYVWSNTLTNNWRDTQLFREDGTYAFRAEVPEICAPPESDFNRDGNDYFLKKGDDRKHGG